jgi:hypothetical protein
MLRFDVPPVWSNAVRMDALTTFTVSVAVLATQAAWLLPLLMLQGLVRGFVGHRKCPSHLAYTALLAKLGAAGKQENAGAKMFANKILLLASSVGFALWLAGSQMWVVPITALVIFSFMEAAFSFCAACWAYTLWYRLRGQ